MRPPLPSSRPRKHRRIYRRREERRALPFRYPPLSAPSTHGFEAYRRHLRVQGALELNHMLRGLLLLGVLALGFQLWRAGLGRVFPNGWRLW